MNYTHTFYLQIVRWWFLIWLHAWEYKIKWNHYLVKIIILSLICELGCWFLIYTYELSILKKGTDWIIKKIKKIRWFFILLIIHIPLIFKLQDGGFLIIQWRPSLKWAINIHVYMKNENYYDQKWPIRLKLFKAHNC